MQYREALEEIKNRMKGVYDKVRLRSLSNSRVPYLRAIEENKWKQDLMKGDRQLYNRLEHTRY
jgi:hypothetical protein